MRILITGHKGFIGREILKSYESDGCHVIYTLESNDDFSRWLKWDLDKALNPMDNSVHLGPVPLDLIIHAGALNNNQYTGSDIYLWNSDATYFIAYAICLLYTSPSPRDS